MLVVLTSAWLKMHSPSIKAPRMESCWYNYPNNVGNISAIGLEIQPALESGGAAHPFSLSIELHSYIRQHLPMSHEASHKAQVPPRSRSSTSPDHSISNRQLRPQSRLLLHGGISGWVSRPEGASNIHKSAEISMPPPRGQH